MTRSGSTFALGLLLAGCSHVPFMHHHSSKGLSHAAGAALAVTGSGKALSRVTSDSVDELEPTLSPDGKVLLLTAQTGDDQVIIGVNPNAGSSRTVYTSSKSWSASPQWLPKGGSFLYVSNAMGPKSLVRALSSAPNAAIKVVVNGDSAPELDHPTISPDGERVAFQTESRGVRSIAVSGLDGSNFTLLTEGEMPSWSPKGDRIAFSRRVGDRQQLFLVDADSASNLVQVTSGDSDSTTPSWSPDGSTLLFSSNRGYEKFPEGSRESTWNLYLVKPDGGDLTQLTAGSRHSGYPCWSKDGWIYFSTNESGNFDIWRFKPGTDA